MSTPDPRRWLMLPVVLSATFMYGFDLNVVNVAIPSLQHDLNAGQAALELIVGGYSFTYAAGLVIGGRLGDLFSYRRMFLIGMFAFTVASLLCGLAQTPVELVAARVLQGATAAAMVPQVLALIAATFPGEERPKALSWFGVVGGLAGVLGQVLGGVLLNADLFGWGWRVIFFLNIPVGLVVLAFALRVLPKVDTGRKPGLDPVGVVSISGSLALALIPMIFGRTEHWPLWTWACLVASVPAMLVALLWEKKLAARGGQPLLDLALFANRGFRLGLAVNVAFMASFTSGIFVLSLLLQSGLHLTALQAGLAFGPMAVLGMAGPMVGRKLIGKVGMRPVMLLGCAVAAAAMVLIGVALQVLGGKISVPWLVVGLALLGFGNTLVLPPLIGATLGGVQPQQAGVASGTLNTTQQFAGTAGLAVIATVFFSRLGNHLDRAAFASAAETVIWINLGLIAVMAALTAVLTKPAAAKAAAPVTPAKAAAIAEAAAEAAV
ncbi:MFS transporter [Kitasatospora sp. NPDC058965]|uniref:MFS transporter n=1 Tax=Kitasatospora sp. NPDC058965 TaxID=3346682 RepID=UPI0036AE740C